MPIFQTTRPALRFITATIIFPLFGALLLFPAWPGPARAETEAGDWYRSGAAYFEKGQFDKAYEYLTKAWEADPANLETSFLLGRAAFETGDHETAIMAYERILIMEPGAARVKLELARCHLKLKSLATARLLLEEVLATKPPEPVIANIERYLKIIDQEEKRHFVNGLFSLAVNWDDNVRTAPLDEHVQTLLGEIPLSGNTATPTEDLIYTGTLVLKHSYKSDTEGRFWETEFINYNALYNDEHDLDILYYGLTSGPVFKTAWGAFTAGVTASHLDFEHDRYLETYGGEAGFALPYGPLALTLDFKLEHRDFFTDPNKDSTYLQLGAGLAFTSGRNRLQATGQRIVENAAQGYNSNDRNAMLLRYDRELIAGLAAGLSWRYQEVKYDATSAMLGTLFGVSREDTINDYSGSLSYRFWQAVDRTRQLVAGLKHQYTDSQSNIGFYTYTKNLTSLSLVYLF